MTRNVTLRMDEELLAEVRHCAVDAHMSLSAWITNMLETLVPRTSEIEEIRTRAISRLESGFHLGNEVISRDKIYER